MHQELGCTDICRLATLFSILDGGGSIDSGAFTSCLRGVSKTTEPTINGESICGVATTRAAGHLASRRRHRRVRPPRRAIARRETPRRSIVARALHNARRARLKTLISFRSFEIQCLVSSNNLINKCMETGLGHLLHSRNKCSSCKHPYGFA